ncbi:MAG: nuclear transport factor 2 family protein [Acidobacteriota bacterium]
MKGSITFASVLFLFAACAYGQSPTAVPDADSRAVFATVSNWADAIMARDMKSLGNLFADDLVVTTYDGKTRSRAEELKMLEPKENVKTTSIKNVDLRVRVYGRAAVVTALTKMEFVISGKLATTSFRYMAVFVNNSGRWQLAALQTAAPPGP